VAALDLVEMNDVTRGRHAVDPLAADGEPRILEGELDMLTGEPREFGGDHVSVAGFVDVDGGRPRVRAMRRQTLEAFMPHLQVPHRIPRHTPGIVARGSC